ncbi:MAG: hypothetical protein BroJett011_09800 [Chloroflexota bacterium]|nr:MAG: hypothetical protein BroJett011_09800 [Chloroflexota bacterium]
MNVLRSLGKRLLLEAELSSSPIVQRAIVPHLNKVKSMGRTLLKPYLNVYQWQGEAQSGSLSVLYAGSDGSNDFLKELLFTQKPTQQPLEPLPHHRIFELIDNTSSDLIIIQANKELINRLPRQSSIRLPQFVSWVINVQGNPEELRLRIPKNMRKDVTRLMREYGYEYEVSYDEQDFDNFYYEMYLPSIKHLHGDLVEPTPYTEAYQYFKHGWLYKIIREGEYICGRLVYVRQGVLYLKLIGLKDADLKLRREGIHHATTYPLLLEANKQGFKFVNLGLTAPFSGLNLFQHKRRWGAAIEATPYDMNQYWFHFCRATPAVTQFMFNNSLVCLDEVDDFCGLLVVDNPASLDVDTLKKLRHLYLVPGMKDLHVCTMADLVGDSSIVNIEANPETRV